jgi:hypothetical protein
MNDSTNEDTLVKQILFAVLELQGKLKANEVIQNSLLSVICQNSPKLIDQIKNNITDVSDLSLSLNEFSSEISASAFSTEIKQSILRFSLIVEASKYSPTTIEVKDRI